MSILGDLLTATGGLLCVGGGVGLVYLFGRDPKADEHDLTDHLPRARAVEDGPAPTAPVRPAPRQAWPLVDRKPMPASRALRPLAPWDPTPAGADGPVPPLARALLIAQAVPTLPDAAVRGIADEWLREIATEQQAAAGVRPARSTEERDLVGAFPVVRAA